MKISEVINPLKLFQATISLHTANDTITVKTAIYAENATHAELMLTALYPQSSDLSIDLNENAPAKFGTQTLTPDQLKLKSFDDQKAKVVHDKQREQARQKLEKSQKRMQMVNAAKVSMTN